MEPDEEPLIRAVEKVKAAAGYQSGEGEPAPLGVEPIDKSGTSIANLPLLAENTPDLNETPEQRLRDRTEGFYAHPLWQRAFVIFAGPFMSFVLGYATIMAVIAFTGLAQDTAVIDHVLPGSEAQKIGLHSHDRFVQIDGKSVTDGDDLVATIHDSANKPLNIVLRRGNQTLSLVGTPKSVDVGDGEKIGELGFAPVLEYSRPTLREVIPDTNIVVKNWFSTLGHLFARHNIKEIRKNAGGPIYIVEVTHTAVQQGGSSLLQLMATLSLSLAVFNLLPIPILDGGHLLLFFIEGLRRGRRLTLEQQQNYMLAGLAVIGTLFVFIMFNDITRH